MPPSGRAERVERAQDLELRELPAALPVGVEAAEAVAEHEAQEVPEARRADLRCLIRYRISISPGNFVSLLLGSIEADFAAT